MKALLKYLNDDDEIDDADAKIYDENSKNEYPEMIKEDVPVISKTKEDLTGEISLYILKLIRKHFHEIQSGIEYQTFRLLQEASRERNRYLSEGGLCLHRPPLVC